MSTSSMASALSSIAARSVPGRLDRWRERLYRRDHARHRHAFARLYADGANVYIQLETITAQTKIVDSITIDSAGTLGTADELGPGDLPISGMRSPATSCSSPARASSNARSSAVRPVMVGGAVSSPTMARSVREHHRHHADAGRAVRQRHADRKPRAVQVDACRMPVPAVQRRARPHRILWRRRTPSAAWSASRASARIAASPTPSPGRLGRHADPATLARFRDVRLCRCDDHDGQRQLDLSRHARQLDCVVSLGLQDRGNYTSGTATISL
jgi:hypothetical protein